MAYIIPLTLVLLISCLDCLNDHLSRPARISLIFGVCTTFHIFRRLPGSSLKKEDTPVPDSVGGRSKENQQGCESEGCCTTCTFNNNIINVHELKYTCCTVSVLLAGGSARHRGRLCFDVNITNV